mgnify:FL=1
MRKNEIKIAGVVAFYKPTVDIVDNINFYINDLDILYVINNSDEKNTKLIDILKAKEKICYIDNHGNQGIANALNVGAQRAIKDEYDWLFTIDSDSKTTPNMITSMLECLELYDPKTIGIVSPLHKNKFGKFSEKNIQKKETGSKVLTTMMSGNLLNLNAYQKVGPFIDKLFVDSVDHEFCLRLNLNNFSIIQANKAILEHNLGNLKKYFWFYSTNYSPIRHYYATRNRLYLINRYKKDFPGFCKKEGIGILKDLTRILITENQKLSKIKAIIQGYQDYHNNIFGKKENFFK